MPIAEISTIQLESQTRESEGEREEAGLGDRKEEDKLKFVGFVSEDLES